MTFHSLSGLGTCDGGYDEYGAACVDFTPVTSDPVATAAAINYLNNPSVPANTFVPTGSAAAGFNWGSFLNSVVGAGAQVGISTLNSSNQAKTAAANAQLLQGQAAATNAASGLTLASMLPFVLMGGGLLLIMSMRKGR
jgi:hypothetical protein